MSKRYSSKNSNVVLTERQAQMLIAAASDRLETNSGPAYFETTKSAFMRVGYKLSSFDLIWFDVLNITERFYMLYASDAGKEWLEGCEERPVLPPLMAYVANMPG